MRGDQCCPERDLPFSGDERQFHDQRVRLFTLTYFGKWMIAKRVDDVPKRRWLSAVCWSC
jgi:hypothetical protein